ncbi:TonB-dependent receptor [Bacteroides sp.]|uniref:TonB-dependent receptor n=1 Tax=Bacteroides sp. TaxID=29523 RepID=UPI002A81B2B4|nr:TonB-dependent receptor [Bacteroides sp.]
MRQCFRVCNRRFLAGVIMFMLLYPMSVFAVQGQIAVQGKAMSIKQAIQVIEKNSKYTFFYKAADLGNAKIRDINCEGSIEEVLNVLFKDSGISYVIKGNEVILKSAPEVVSTPQQSNKIVVKGNIRDNLGEAIIGATIMEKNNAQNGTISNVEGNFSLSVNPGAVIVISYIGYVTQEVKAVAGVPLKIVLKDDSRTLDEVVVVGFGSQKKANLTGAVSSIKMDEIIGDRPIMTASDALQGTVPGLLVSNSGNAPGSGKSFQLRGAYSVGIKNSDGSYGANVAPLILIDNVEGSLDMLNPEDIETVTVLKDAASAAIYGARAAGGVVLVTTKRPKEATAFRLNYNNNFGFATAMNLPKQASLMDYLQAYQDGGYSDAYWSYGSPSVSKWKEYLTQYRQDPSSIKTVGDGIFADTDGALYYLNEHDPYKNFMETSFQMNHNLSVSGGTDKLRYRMSAGYVSTDGVLITDKDTYERLNINSYISADITKWFTQELTMSYARTNQSQPSSGLGSMFGSNQVSYQPEGNMPADVCSTISQDLPFNTPRNQVLLANKWKKSYDNPRVFVKSILKPFKGFEGVFEYTFDKNMYDYNFYTGKTQYTDIQGGNNIWNAAKDYLQKEKQFTDYNAFNIYGTYKFDIKKDHHFSVMAGFNQESKYTEGVNVLSYNQAVIEVPALGSGTGDLKATDSYNEYSVRGGFFRVNYNYMDKYLLEVNGRYDGSSKFPKDSRFGFFPSVSLGWNVAQEKFMEVTRNYIDGLKIRASYGVIGNQNVVNYAYFPTMSVSNKYNGWLSGGDYVTAINSLPNLVSTSFTWEKVATTDIGLDLNMFGNRLNAVFDWYQRDTKGMLAPGMQLPAVVGASSPFQNTADMRTRGWELAVNWRDRIGKFNYRVGFNLSDSYSEITKYDDNAASKLLSNFYPGQRLGEIWGYEVDGFYTVDDFVDTNSWKLKDGVASIKGVSPRPGDLKFKNLRDDDKSTNQIDSGDGTLDNPGDQKVIGNSLPKYLYGITLGANYKGFDLNIMMQGTGQRDAWIANNLVFPMYIYSVNDIKYQPLFDGLTDYWKPVDAANGDYTAVNPNAKYPRMYGQNPTVGSNYGRKTDRYLSNAAYFRIKNVTLSYTVPKTWISRIGLNQLKGFVSVENLATFSSLPSGIDPETLSWNYPAFRTVSFGINFTL